ncbi:MAG: sodium-translocating pyrophosphatase [Gemmatimonadales bacterium]|nr:MAG: sodium-translocating pyrophosphatase [Gemmatimonadales bacterium]
MDPYLVLTPLAAIVALLAAGLLARGVLRADTGSARMVEISDAVREGASAYMNRQYRTITYVALAIVAIFALVALAQSGDEATIWWWTTVGFAVGALFSGLSGYAGMNVAVRANVRVAQAASRGLPGALKIAFNGGAVAGLAVAGLALLGVAGFFWLFWGVFDLHNPVEPLVGFAFGASLISLFARVGGGIYTKAADVGADLVGKVEAGIPEDDPRNPAVIADNVGDNVGDCAGMGADLFETYAVTVIGAIFLGYLLPDVKAVTELVTYPLYLGAVAIVASILGVFFVKLGKDGRIMPALYRGVFASAILSVVGFAGVTWWMFSGFDFAAVGGMLSADTTWVDIFLASIVGIVVVIGMIFITEYYTSTRYGPVRKIAKASETGAATNIIAGLAVGLQSTLVPTVILVLAMFLSFLFAGLYGIGVAAVAMLSVTGMIVAMDTYGPITDNAGGIAEMAELPPETRVNTDALDAVGNTTKATTKGYAIGSAALAALVLFADYVFRLDLGMDAFRLNDPIVLIGVLIGAMLPFLFSAFLMDSVGKAAGAVIEEVRRQFREIPGIMEGTGKPEYDTCVDIVTKAALREMILPGMISVFAPLLVGFLLGPLALGGLLIGVIASGLMVALMMSNGGGAWDNAKKYIEDGNHGGKGSAAHEAAIVGDTVGDPYKDTAGPAINPLIKVINTVALIFAPLIAAYGGWLIF